MSRVAVLALLFVGCVDPNLNARTDPNDPNGPDGPEGGIDGMVDGEYCNGKDDDGDGEIDEGCRDTDGDGVPVCRE